MLFLNSEDFVFRLIRRLTNVIQVDSQIELSDRDRLRKYVDREKGRKSLSSMPWESYWKIFQLKFNRFVTVAVPKEPLRKYVIVKRFSESDSQEELRMIHSIRHDHIVTVLETFRFEGSFYVVLERMAISLVQIVASPPYPGEQELAAILGQVYRVDMKSRSMC